MGQEFQVNSYSADFQANPDVTVFADGGYLVVWDSYYSGVSTGLSPTTYVAAQRFSADNRPLGTETIIFAGPETSSDKASVTALRGGGYVVMWQFDDYDAILTTSSRIYARIYNANGSERTEAFRVDLTPDKAATNPQALATANGGFIVTYSVYKSPYSDVFQRGYDAQGDALGGQVRVNDRVSTNSQFGARSETLSDGRILTAWTSVSTFDEPGPGSFRNEVRGSIRAADGHVIKSDFHLTLDFGTIRQEAGGFDISALNTGGFAVSHEERGRNTSGMDAILVDRFGAAGEQVGSFVAHRTSELILDTEVIQLATGEIVVVWNQSSESSSNIGNDVDARIFTANGVALSNSFLVSTDRNNTDDQSAITARALPGGGFIVTYQSDSIDGDEDGIAARIFGRGTAGNDRLSVDVTGHMNGLSGNDTIYGNAGSNVLNGGVGADRLFGGAGRDLLIGAVGRDVMAGGGGRDTFVFRNVAETGTARQRDIISDFQAGFDRVNLTAIDANEDRRGNQAFDFIGAARFSGDAGDLRLSRGILSGDTDGDGRADFEIALTGISRLTDGDFFL